MQHDKGTNVTVLQYYNIQMYQINMHALITQCYTISDIFLKKKLCFIL